MADGVKRRERQTKTEQWECHDICHHLIVIPVPEKVDRSVPSGLDNSPAPIVYVLFTPDLQWSLGIIGFDHIHATGAMARFLCLETVFERPLRGKYMSETTRQTVFMG